MKYVVFTLFIVLSACYVQAQQDRQTVTTQAEAFTPGVSGNSYAETSADAGSAVNLVNPVITASGPTNFCSGDSVTLSVIYNALFVYKWYRNDTVVFTGSGPGANRRVVKTSGAYKVGVDSAGVITVSPVVPVTVHPLPDVTISPLTDAAGEIRVCYGKSITLSVPAAAGNRYQWYQNLHSGSQGPPIPGATGNSYSTTDSLNSLYYSVNVTTAQGCSKWSVLQYVRILSPLPDEVIIPRGYASPICAGGYTLVELRFPALDTPSYQWQRNGVDVPGANLSVIRVESSGDYSLVMHNRVAQGVCSVRTNTRRIIVLPSPVAVIVPAGPTTICQGDSVVLNVSPPDTGYFYNWFRDGVNIGFTFVPRLTVTTPGNYSVNVSVLNCTSTSGQVAVAVRPLPVAAITAGGPLSFCRGGSVVLSTPVTAGYSWQWFRNDTLIGGATGSSYTATLGGRYTVRATDANGCKKVSPAITVTVLPSPPVTISPSNPTLIKSRSLTLTAGGAVSHNWLQPLYTESISGNTIVIRPPVSTTYRVEGTGSNGCKDTAATLVNVVGCGDVTNLQATVYTAARALLQWTNPAGVTDDTLEYKALSDIAWNRVYVQGNQYMLNGLQPNTQYMFRVVSLCTTSSLFFYADTGYFQTPVLNDLFLKTYPSPFNRQFTLEIIATEPYTGLSIDIFNASGIKMITLANGESGPRGQIIKTIYAPEWTPGYYTCVVRMNGKRYTVRFQKQQ